jgi:LmbE family N-acetylglucosaminyl deacetylase
VHLWNLANGCLGSTVHPRDVIAPLRAGEAQAAAAELGATWHAPLADDLAIFYTPDLLAQVASVIRQVQPRVILTHSPSDYMEDHMNAARLTVTAAFVRGAPNYVTQPPTPAWDGDTAIYHAMPHGLRDPLRLPVRAEFYVDTAPVMARKRSLLAKHASQGAWLTSSQGMGSFVDTMEAAGRQVGALSGAFELAEGWRRHSHLGFSAADEDPLAEALRDVIHFDPLYRAWLERGIYSDL